jgi:hypothetical protein
MYTITIERDNSDGVLTFSSPNKVITTKCYWNLTKKIPATTYLNCSATTMSRKKNSRGNPREAIFLPGVVGFSEIFIHLGKPPYAKWSDGCVVIDENKMIEIYNAITPKNGHNVTVVIKD